MDLDFLFIVEYYNYVSEEGDETPVMNSFNEDRPLWRKQKEIRIILFSFGRKFANGQMMKNKLIGFISCNVRAA